MGQQFLYADSDLERDQDNLAPCKWDKIELTDLWPMLPGRRNEICGRSSLSMPPGDKKEKHNIKPSIHRSGLKLNLYSNQ